jgi:surface protein
MNKITLWCAALLIFIGYFKGTAQLEGPDFPSGPTTDSNFTFNLEVGTNTFSGLLNTPSDGQDNWQIVLGAGQSITSITYTIQNNSGVSNGFFAFGTNQEAFAQYPQNFSGSINSGSFFNTPGTYAAAAVANTAANASWSVTVNVSQAATPSPPVVTSNAIGGSFSENGPAIALNNLVSISDSSNITQMVITNRSGGAGAEENDVISLSSPNGYSISSSANKSQWTITGNGTAAQATAALRSAMYQNTGQNPTIFGVNNGRGFNLSVTNASGGTTNVDSGSYYSRGFAFIINDAPTGVITNTLTANNLETTTITSSQLQGQDPDDRREGLIFRVNNTPSNGNLRLNGATLNVNNTFTQDDINNNRVRYQNTNGSASTDNFGFSLADGGEDGAPALTGRTFTISINQPVNNAPTATSFLARPKPINGFNKRFSAADFGFSDQDSDPFNNLLIEVIPTVGTLYIDANDNNSIDANEQLTNGDRVTINDLNSSRLKYIQNGTTNTSFQFEVNDGTDDSTGNYIATLDVVDRLIINTNSTDISCNGSTDGSITATISGGVPPYTIEWSTGNGGGSVFAANVLMVDNLSASNYTVRVQDDDGNTFQISGITISEPDVLTATASVINNVSTTGGNDGRARANPSGGTSPYNYSWSNGSTTRNISGLTAGTYTVDVSDANGCMASRQSATITEPEDTTAPTVTSITRQNPATSPTNADELTWEVLFSENVNFLGPQDFELTGTTAFINVTSVNNALYRVSAIGGDLVNLNGTVALQIGNSQDISDDANNTLVNTTPTGANEIYEVSNVNPEDAFITTWRTTTSNESISIPTTGGGYNYTIDWGDGTNTTSQTENATHQYATAGTYTVAINGDFPRIFFNNAGDKDKILTIEQWGTQVWQGMDSAFFGCTNLSSENADDIPTFAANSTLFQMFKGCTIFNSSLDNWNLENVRELSFMFNDAINFNGAIGSWNTSNITNMQAMFSNASSFNQDISGWNTESVKLMNAMFSNASNFSSDLSSWDIGSVTTTSSMFQNAVAFNSDISSWNTASVEDMRGMFKGATTFNQDISSWDVSTVSLMREMFSGASFFNQDIGGWDVSNVFDMVNMFSDVTLSTENYDALLVGWNALDLQSNVSFNGGNSQYCNGAIARQSMIDVDGWIITDGGSQADDTSFSFPQDTYFRDSDDPTPTITGVFGGTFTSTSGLEINSTTGTIDISATTPGSYVVTYTTNGDCSNSSQVTVTIERCLSTFLQRDVLAIQDFEETPGTPTWNFTGTVVYNSGSSSNTDSPPNSFIGINGSRAWETTSESGGITLDFDNIVIPQDYEEILFNFRLAAMDLTGSNGGPDNLDFVKVSYSLDNGATYTQRLTIRGGTTNNSFWAYDASGEALVDHLPANESTFQPSGTGLRTTDGFSTNGISFPGNTSQIKIRIKARSSTNSDTWLIDNVTLLGVSANTGNPIVFNNSNLVDVVDQCVVDSITAPTATDRCTGITLTGTTPTDLPITTQGTTVVTWTYDDGNGNTSTQTQNVVIEDVTSPIPDVMTLADVEAECQVETLVAPTATDNCSGDVTVSNDADLPITTQGITVVTWRYEDMNGNTSSQTQNVVIEDVSGPVADVGTLEDITAECIVENISIPSATDNCTGPVEGTTDIVFPIEVQGTTEITWTYEDDYGNITTQTQNVIIEDVTAPVPIVAVLPDISEDCAVLSLPIPKAADNCSGSVTGVTTTVLPITTPETTVVVWSYTDDVGNVQTQTQNVTVNNSPLDQVVFNDETFIYDGDIKDIEVLNLPNGASVVYSTTPSTGTANGAINAGIYTVSAVITPPSTSPNCDEITLTATLTIDKSTQEIVFNPIPVNEIGVDPDFQLMAEASSGLPITYTYTYTGTNQPADVSAEGFVTLLATGQATITANQEGDNNYLPATPVSQELIIESSNANINTITIDGQVYNDPDNLINYIIDCGSTVNSVQVVIDAEPSAIVTPATVFEIETPVPGIYLQDVVVTSQNGTMVRTYTIRVEKHFLFNDIAEQKFDNVLLVNNNPSTNGGYSFVAYEWYKDNVLVGTEQYYSAGATTSDLLDPNSTYFVKMTTVSGDVLQTCAINIELQHSYSISVTPNPTAQLNRTLNVSADILATELNNMIYTVFNMSGKVLKQGRYDTISHTVRLPETIQSGIYMINFRSPNVNKVIKLIVE